MKGQRTEPHQQTMRAAVYERYGGPEVVQVREVPAPTPGPREVRICVYAGTVSSGDWRMRSASIPKGFGLIAPLMFGRRPKQQVLGTALAGVVESVGAEVTQWSPGEEVFAFPGGKMGAHAEYVCMPQDGRIARKPERLSFATAAALCFGGSTALSFFDKGGGIGDGERVLIVGASGEVGSAAVQIAVHLGAEVTGVCSGTNTKLVESLGAAQVLDYTRHGFEEAGAVFDVVIDTVGTVGIERGIGLLAKGGRLLLVYASFGDMVGAPWTSLTKGRTVIAGPAAEEPAHLPRLAELAEAGAFTPVIDGIWHFDEIVEAHRRVDTGHKRGSVVVTL